jgi:two-component system, cell cycle response regulator DivK
MAGETVLVVDDNHTNLKLLHYLLVREGYDVHTAVDAEHAMTALETVRPVAILLDLQLPGMDGLTLTRRLRTVIATRNVVIVAVTAHAMKGEEERAFAAGCDAFITKPIDTRSLPITLAALIAAKGLSRRS